MKCDRSGVKASVIDLVSKILRREKNKVILRREKNKVST